VNFERIEEVANAVLYEGYMLYPYRPSALKNQQRWNFGVLCPPAYCELQKGSESSSMQTEVLLLTHGSADLSVKVRFLQIVQRSISDPPAPVSTLSKNAAPDLNVVDRLEVDGGMRRPWQEAVEREVPSSAMRLESSIISSSIPFHFAKESEPEIVSDRSGGIFGVVTRQWEGLSGSVDIAIERLQDCLFKATVRIHNLTPFDPPANASREQALMFSFASAHTILGVEGGEFISLLDPPAGYQDQAAGCENVGTWPVLAGDEGSSQVMLSSPIILYDHPQIAPESAGNLFDSTEIDEILLLRIMTLTDDEKREIRQCDDRVRGVLDRTEKMPEEQFLKLHGVLRGLQPLKETVR
jgi:hydrogenase maturation protease